MITEPAAVICSKCEKVFYAKYAYICPDCRKKFLSELAKRRGLNKIGNKAYSEKQRKKHEEKIRKKGEGK